MQKPIRVVQVPDWRKISYFIPASLWTMLIWSLSTTKSVPHIPFDFLSPDKVGHLVFYCTETLLLIWAVSGSQRWEEEKKGWVILCMILAGLYGTSLEFVQAGIPERSFDYADMTANFVGVIAGYFIYRKTSTRYFIKQKPENQKI
jgi:VanZ family protein